MTFLDWARPRRRRDVPHLPEDFATAANTERGAGYLAVRRTVEAAQVRIASDAGSDQPIGRQSAAYARLDRMYEVAILVASACEAAGVPAPPPVDAWPEELVRLRDRRECNAREWREFGRNAE